MRVFTFDEQLFYIPDAYIKIANSKVESLHQHMGNIQKIIL